MCEWGIFIVLVVKLYVTKFEAKATSGARDNRVKL